MKKKILFTASIAKHLLRFHLPYLQWFQQQGYEVHVACNGEEKVPFTDKKWTIPFVRSPYSSSHIKAFSQLKKIIDREHYALIHCHTPMASIVTRLAAKDARKKGTKVIYTAHGFHFFKEAPLINWLFYYPIEKMLSGAADGIVTINREDYQLLIDKRFNTKYKYQINGIGVNPERFNPLTPAEKNGLRNVMGYKSNQFILVYVAEFIHRKNHKFIIEAASELADKIPNLKILFAGRGVLLEKMEDYTKKLGLEKTVDFLGFRNDIEKVIAISDVGISASRQEGLPLNLIEEMFCGLPIIATSDRGHREIVEHCCNGYLFEQNYKKEFIKYILQLYHDPEKRISFGIKSFDLAKKFSLNQSVESMAAIYNELLGDSK